MRAGRITILPVHGTSRSKSLIEADLLRRFNVPLFVLFDNTAEPDTPERKAIKQFLDHWPVNASKPVIVPFGVPDMFRVLPDELFMRVLAGAEWNKVWPTWKTLEERFENSTATSFKQYFLRALKCQEREQELLSALLAQAEEQPLLESPLHPAMQSVFMHPRVGRAAFYE